MADDGPRGAAELHSVHVQLTGQVLAATSPEDPVDDRVAEWQERESIGVKRAVTTLEEICADDKADLARLSVGLRVVRTLLTTP